LVSVVTDNLRAGPVAQHQAERVDQDGLARAGLAGKRGHARGELQFELVDDGEVTDVNVRQHGVEKYRSEPQGASVEVVPSALASRPSYLVFSYCDPSQTWFAVSRNSRNRAGES